MDHNSHPLCHSKPHLHTAHCNKVAILAYSPQQRKPVRTCEGLLSPKHYMLQRVHILDANKLTRLRMCVCVCVRTCVASMSRLSLILALIALSSCLLSVSAHRYHSHGTKAVGGDVAYEQMVRDLSNPALFKQAAAGTQDWHPVALAPFPPHTNASTYYSYHVHVYFLVSNKNQTAYARQLRQSYIDEYKVIDCTEDCDTLCPVQCHWDFNEVPMGPHPVGSFGIYVPLANTLDALRFFSLNHGELSVLVHPNSGYPKIDHGPNSFWIHQMLPLDLSQLDDYEPPKP